MTVYSSDKLFAKDVNWSKLPPNPMMSCSVLYCIVQVIIRWSISNGLYYMVYVTIR